MDSNRVDSTTFSTLPVRLLVWFVLSVSQIDYPVSRTDYTTDDSSRIDSNRVDSTTFSTLPVHLVVWFFLSVSQIDFPVSRIDLKTDDSSRIETSRHYLRRIESVWVYWTTLTKCVSILFAVVHPRISSCPFLTWWFPSLHFSTHISPNTDKSFATCVPPPDRARKELKKRIQDANCLVN